MVAHDDGSARLSLSLIMTIIIIIIIVSDQCLCAMMLIEQY